MKKILMAMAILATFSVAQASELDNEDQVKNAQRFAKDLPQTLVVRVQDNGTVAVMHSNELLAGGQGLDGKFTVVNKTEKVRGELDGDSSASGWYFYWYNYNYSYPTYYYYGYNYSYQPYYSYYSNYSWYYWYSWRRW